MSPHLAAILACPSCRGELAHATAELVCRRCERPYRVINGVPVLLEDPGPIAIMSAAHESNALGAEFDEILERGQEFILHLGAGATAKKYPNCVELEHKIFCHTDVVGDAHALPFQEATFDRVMGFNVFEHLENPRRAATEILRILKPGGFVVIHTAFLQPLHEAPRHFFNATEFGVRQWFQDFEIEQCRVSGNFSPGFTLGFLAASLLETLRESEVPAGKQAQIAQSRLEQWAAFWNRKSDPPPGFNALLTLPQEFQKRLAAGFELLARKPGSAPEQA